MRGKQQHSSSFLGKMILTISFSLKKSTDSLWFTGKRNCQIFSFRETYMLVWF
jgi:hypothetical protein